MKIVVCGEAWGREEEERRQPFVGPSGRFLHVLLSQAGIHKADCFLTNVFNLRPRPTNDVSNLCGPKAEGIPGMRALSSGKYVRAEFQPELERLYEEVRREQPNLIIALGNTALWALTGQTSIKANRGSVIQSHLGYKVLPTFHPAAILRQYTLRPVVMADLAKAAREAEFPDIRRPQREIWLEPTVSDIEEFYVRHVQGCEVLSADIETKGDRIITCVGFAPSPSVAIVIPFFDHENEDANYWPTLEDEVMAWEWVRKYLEHPRLLGQNFLYDMNFLWRTMGIPAPNGEDSMLLHHALQPELEKGLGFLGSIYTNEQSWKIMRKAETHKREDQ